MDIDQNRLWSDIQELGRIGRSPDGGITRLAFAPQGRQAQDWLEVRMRDAGLAVREDAADSLVGELCGSRLRKPCVICGSHYDTVPGGGQFNGTLGILSALEAVRRIRERGTVTERTVCLATFKDEEESRFGCGMVGGESIYNILDSEGLTSVDKDGISLEQTVADYGCRPGQLASRKMEDVGTYLELHIGQGEVLEDHRTFIGVISGITGLMRYTVEIRGESGRAGATPIKVRKDPVPAMYRWVDRVTELAGARESCVATVSSITAYPGAQNVICERVVPSLDLRFTHQEDLREIAGEIERYGAELSSLHGVEVSLGPDQVLPPCRCYESLRRVVENICRSEEYSFMKLMNRAGHDCVDSKGVCPTAMIFMPSEGGVFHRREESTSRENCVRRAGVPLGLLLKTADVSDKID